MRRAILGLLLAAGSCASPVPGRSFQPTAIVLHSTSGLDLESAIDSMVKRGTGVHALVDRDGGIHQLCPFDRPTRGARGVDDIALHVSVVGGVGSELLVEPVLLENAAILVDELATKFRIPRSNADVISRRGIFSHQQVKYRFGGLKRSEEKGRMEPGEDFMKALLNRIGGIFAEEKDWVGRSEEGWVCVWEGGNLGRRGELSKGRGFNTHVIVPLPPLRWSEERRLQYVDRGSLEELRGIVLHFTATKTYDEAVSTFERRRLGPSIIVDVDGRAWQVVDMLTDKVAAAAGTNDHCIQIEVVGENEESLLSNPVQLRSVAAVLKSLAADRLIPLNNRDIDSLRGVFSHGQAKKRWGRSAWMWGDEYDPGERYMKVVLEAAGGTYVPEREWAGRQSGEWAVSEETWLP